jgi:hypothetical protein
VCATPVVQHDLEGKQDCRKTNGTSSSTTKRKIVSYQVADNDYESVREDEKNSQHDSENFRATSELNLDTLPQKTRHVVVQMHVGCVEKSRAKQTKQINVGRRQASLMYGWCYVWLEIDENHEAHQRKSDRWLSLQTMHSLAELHEHEHEKSIPTVVATSTTSTKHETTWRDLV